MYFIIKLVIIFFFFIILIYCFLFYSNYETYEIKNNESNNFYEILPKTISTYKNNNISRIEEIFNSNQLFISDINLTNNYIHFIRRIKEKNEKEELLNNNNKKEIKFSLDYFKIKENKINYTNFSKFCLEGKLIESININYNMPIISVILPSFNKANIILKSLRSIQNQSFKNIEIIIVDDCSTDNSSQFFKYLLKTDPRIRIFTHLKNMGVWRSRLDGFLYSRGKYIIHFDPGDFYSDQYVLEDAYNLMQKYKLDSIKMMFRLIFNYSKIGESSIPFNINSNFTKIVYESHNIKKYNEEIFSTWGNIWTRLTKSNIITKGLYLLDSTILNIYKNLWEDCWWNRIIDESSSSLLIINRNAYLYYKDGNGEGDIKINTAAQKDKIIHEFIYFLYFDLNLSPKKDNKNKIIYKLYQYTKKKEKINLSFLKSNFDVLKKLLLLLIKDPFVSNLKKVFLRRLLKESIKKEKKFIN